MSPNPPTARLDSHGRWDPHEILGVAPGASRDQINAAYRSALRRLHPDTRQVPPTTSDQQERHDQQEHPSTGPPVSLADLQAARRQLLDQAGGEPTRAAGQQADRPTGPSAIRPARYLRRPGEPDAVAGPVRYHGPAR
jgi:DnaJ-like protein